MIELSFFDLWREYIRAKTSGSADYKAYSDELNKRIAETMALLKCDKKEAISNLMKR